MVDEGLVTLDQLSVALAEQDRSGNPLGQVLVDLGFVSQGAVANALAEQHGGLLKTEFGVSAGLRATGSESTLAEVKAPEPIDRATRIEQLEAALRTVVAERDTFAQQVDKLHARLSDAPPPGAAEGGRAPAAATARIAELEAEVQAQTSEAQAQKAEVARITAAAVAHINGLEAKLAELSSAAADPAETEAEVARATAAATARVAELEAEVARATAATARIAELENEVQERTSEANAHKAEVARITAAAVARVSGLEAKLAELSSATTEPVDTEAEVARATAAATARIAELEAALEARANEPPQPDEAEIAQPTEAATARIAELEAKLDATNVARSELASAVAAGSTRISELERDISALRKQAIERLQEGGAEAEAPEPAPVLDEDGHLRLIPAATGYTILEWPGPAPDSGTLLDVDGVRFVVLRVAVSPFPGSRMRCAYLDRV